MNVTEEQKNKFYVDGFIVFEDLIDLNQIKLLANQCDLIGNNKIDKVPITSTQLEPDLNNLNLEQSLKLRKLFNIAVYDNFFWDHVTNKKIVSIISELLNTKDIKLYGDQLFMKPPEIGSEIHWHQDSASWKDIFPYDLVTAWTAIDESKEINGCLQFIPGSHRLGVLGLDSDSRIDKMNRFKQLIDSDIWPIIKQPMRPGSVSFHHSLTIHSSAQNKSKERRRGYAAHYMRANSWKDDRIFDAPKMPNFRQVSGKSYNNCV